MKNECPLGNEVMNYKLVFDLTRVHKRAMNLFFHHHPEDAMMGLNDNYWLLSSAETKVFSGERIDLVLAKQKRITKAGRGGGGGGGGEQTAGEYFECIRRFMGFVYSRISDWTNGTAFCSSPIYNSFFNYIPGLCCSRTLICTYSKVMRSEAKSLPYLSFYYSGDRWNGKII